MSDDLIYKLSLRRKKKGSRLKKIFYLFFILAVIYIIFNNLITTPFSLYNPFSNSQNIPDSKFSKSLEALVQTSLAGSEGIYGIVIKNLKIEEKYSNLEDKIFDAGSLYKLWVMAETIRQVQNGQLNLDETLSEDIAVLNKDFNIDPDSAEMQRGTITLTVDQSLNQMITISHNYAALLLIKKIGLSSIKDFLQNNNLDKSTVGTGGENPTTTPSDIALFLEKLYKGELASVEYTQKMMDLLKRQTLNDKLAKYLPTDSIAHKTGEIGWFSHDAGIIFLDGKDYLIVVLSETNSPAGAEERMANLSKAVYEHFQKSTTP
ncbi:hypothetical protein A3B45_04780 [Candidatus Daviesbacteria bacterium RIFCSPLOWO2_01_FULL_39_12]|uniref:Beta-lactamase class A catalytic domain-containing protein n=1 Tax=Candidatus Daviesbacteria bacterium RIFCSPLOWO2_01_FULL_39_12 TaxID=1797785 RepID=A0A1F5KLH4_9BACT|nr:MAG: hypothetical protein A3D79_01205 [Candidatus Daviesbacteria bacterium RIFCSPHIGHO2_02_FULL_39_8]OGE41670.1 MAG: hypothetical protein A3B45_04780 [Candidatus Daviesbacteria bacterium RIFCSPLOWO2_01_FULL_39_12]